MHTCKITRVMAYALELGYAVVTAHIPSNVVRVSYNDFGDSGCPTSTAYYCNLAAIVHSLFACLFVLANWRVPP